MKDEAYKQADNAAKYFTVCLLAFYQQLWLPAGALHPQPASIGVSTRLPHSAQAPA